MIGGKKQRNHVTKEDVSSPMVSEEAVVLTCVTDAQKERNAALVGIPNAFAQTVVIDDDEEHQVICRIQKPLVDASVSIAPDVYVWDILHYGTHVAIPHAT